MLGAIWPGVLLPADRARRTIRKNREMIADQHRRHNPRLAQDTTYGSLTDHDWIEVGKPKLKEALTVGSKLLDKKGVLVGASEMARIEEAIQKGDLSRSDSIQLRRLLGKKQAQDFIWAAAAKRGERQEEERIESEWVEAAQTALAEKKAERAEEARLDREGHSL